MRLSNHPHMPSLAFARAQFIGKDRFVADHREGVREAGNPNHVGSDAAIEAAGELNELGDADSFEPYLERQVFAKRNQVVLVVTFDQKSASIEDLDRIVIADPSPRPLVFLPCARRP